MKRKIAPSLMCSDFLDLRKECDLFKANGIEYLHIDIMDGHYVPNFSLGIDFCRAVSSYTGIPLDIHLMMEDPDRYIGVFSEFEGCTLCVHPETSYQPLRTVQQIQKRGCRAGISLSPSCPLGSAEHLLPYVDLLCIMTVHPGYAGQTIVTGTLKKLEEAARLIEKKGYGAEVEVDGNVSWENLPKMRDAGATVFVAGTSSIFQRGADMEESIRRFREILEA
ncbi:MAG: ribulose-phosphate 3-epimerase [Spirochaetes bacterium]|nr:ribulose-phosphate 3-epimerase [Spirochaetota bacterium]